MPFVDTIRALPFAPRTTGGRGFLPPMVRAMGHILYALGCLTDETIPKTDEDILHELREANEHWRARIVATAVSDATNQNSIQIGTAISDAIEEYANWDAETRTQNLRDLANRIVQYAANLDRELVGHRESDPGSAL